MRLASCAFLALSLLQSFSILLTSKAQATSDRFSISRLLPGSRKSATCSRRAIPDDHSQTVMNAIRHECESAIDLMTRPILHAIDQPLHIYNPIVGERLDQGAPPRTWTHGRCRISLTQPPLHPAQLEEASIDHMDITGQDLRTAAMKIIGRCVTDKKRLGGYTRLRLIKGKRKHARFTTMHVTIGVPTLPHHPPATPPPPAFNPATDNQYSRDLTCLGAHRSATARASRDDCVTALKQLTQELGTDLSATLGANRPELMIGNPGEGASAFYQTFSMQHAVGRCQAEFWTEGHFALEEPLNATITLAGILSLATEIVDTCLVRHQLLGGGRTIRVDNQRWTGQPRHHLRLHVRLYVPPDHRDPAFQEMLAGVWDSPEEWDVAALAAAVRHINFEPEPVDQVFSHLDAVRASRSSAP
jgi:hypothetical protein